MKFPRPSPSVFAYCKRSKTGGVEGLGTRLGPLSAAVIRWQFLVILSLEKMAAPRTSYRDMVLNAFEDIPVDPDGLTRDTISEYIRSKQNIEEDCDVEVKRALKALIEEGLVVQNSDTKRYQAVQTGPPVESSFIRATVVTNKGRYTRRKKCLLQ